VESKTAKYTFLGTIMAAIITGAIGLYIHLDGQGKIEKMVAKKAEAEKSKGTARLTISNVYVPPVNTAQDSSFFVEISNGRLHIAKDVNVKINFGEASISSCETLPVNVLKGHVKYNTSIVSFSVGNIAENDSVYVYCLLSSPVLESILVTGPNLFNNSKYTYSPSTKENEGSSFINFFKVIASIVAVIFIGYFTIVILSLLNKKFNVE
jgi:hypothetical protein